jgi:hypothetical protein
VIDFALSKQSSPKEGALTCCRVLCKWVQEEEREAAEALQLRLAQQVAAARRAKGGQRAEGKAEGATNGEESSQAGNQAATADGNLPPEELNERLRALGQPIM